MGTAASAASANETLRLRRAAGLEAGALETDQPEGLSEMRSVAGLPAITVDPTFEARRHHEHVEAPSPVCSICRGDTGLPDPERMPLVARVTQRGREA